jgi:hypothetical protein
MTTEERLEKLERELTKTKRRNRWLLGGVGLVLGMFALAWATIGTAGKAQAQATGPAKKVIHANEFILEDENGKVRVVLSARTDGSGLFLYDENSKELVMLAVNKAGPGLALCDAKGEPRVQLTAEDDGARLILSDEKGLSGAALGVLKNGPELRLFDDKSKTRAMLGVNKDGPALTLCDENSRPRAVMYVFKDGPGMDLFNFDKDGRVLSLPKDNKKPTRPVLTEPSATPAKTTQLGICPSCNGSGLSGFACTYCNGTGKQNGSACGMCRGGIMECIRCRGTGHTKE